MPEPILVFDLGSTSARVSLVSELGEILKSIRVATPPITPSDGIVEINPQELLESMLEPARELTSKQPVSAVGITDHRASTIVWERKTGVPIANMISWQDLRTVGACLELQSQGLRLLPNQSATKLQYLLQQVEDPSKYCFGTPESWLVWNLTEGRAHITDASHSGVTGLVELDGQTWDQEILSILDIPDVVLPEIVDTMGMFGEASLLPGNPPITGLIGDQQASLIGQGCLSPGQAKLTLGTGGMLDICQGSIRPSFDLRGENGTFPIIAWRENKKNTWGIEAAMLNAGSAIDWVVSKMGLAEQPADTSALAAPDSGAVKFVPAFTGLGTPYWDFGARASFFGVNLATQAGQILRAVLEGIANHSADIIQAAECDAGKIESLRVDGGMSQNNTFLQCLADASGFEIEISSETECTSLGVAYLAGTAIGNWENLEQTAQLYKSAEIFTPNPNSNIREGWKEAVENACAWHPELSAIEF